MMQNNSAMNMGVRTKICGVKTPQILAAAVDAGVAYVGFVFFEKSPRHVSYDLAHSLALQCPVEVAKVGLVVNPTDDDLKALLDVVPLDMLQLHGSETPQRATEVKDLAGLPVMKAVGIAGQDDIAKAQSYVGYVDQLLLDAKPTPDAALPGGNGLRFDWHLTRGIDWGVPWMLAGGLTPDNVAQAIMQSGAQQVDVSSGVESAKGQKDVGLIRKIIAAASA